MGRRNWPNPDDTQQDIDRAIAGSYRAALLEEAPARCLTLDRAARQLGQHWVAPLPDDTQPGDRVTTLKASQLLGVEESTIRSWGSRDWVPVTRYDDGWDMRELWAYKASQTRRRGHR